MPKEVERGREGREGVARFAKLVEEWRERGGEEANDGMDEGGEVVEGMVLN